MIPRQKTPSHLTKADKAARHRDAQIRYRNKKENRIATLLQTIETLQQQSNFNSLQQPHPIAVTSCPHCTRLSDHIIAAKAKLCELERTVAKLEERLRPSSRVPSANLSVFGTPFSSDVKSPLPSPVRGPALDLGILKSELKALDSLRESPLVDEFIRLRMEWETLDDDQSKRVHRLGLQQCQFKLLDSTSSVTDRAQILRIITWFRARHPMMVEPIPEAGGRKTTSTPTSSNGSTPSESTAVHESAVSFRRALKGIESLNNDRADELIGELVDAFWTWHGYGGDRTAQETQDHILNLKNLSRSLGDMCCDEDSVQAQIAYRLRKEARITELQQLVEHLERQLQQQRQHGHVQGSEPQEPRIVLECANCANQKAKLDQLMTALRSLEEEEIRLVAEKASLPQNHAPLPDSTPSLVSASAESVANPIVSATIGVFASAAIASAGLRNDFRNISSLRDNPQVEQLIELYMGIDAMADAKRKRILPKLERIKFKLIDSCNIHERNGVIEILAGFQQRNPLYPVPVPDLDALSTGSKSTDMRVLARVERDSIRGIVKAIPSLSASGDVIDLMFDECVTWEGLGGNRTQEETQEYLVKLNGYLQLLSSRCLGGDLIQLHMAMDVGRIANKQIWDTLYDEALGDQ
ncbi:hypothetical protein HDU98_007462 [Podochytrium sp. JEL0797]|nr:hypothetical protein HDU98_007462 [Podochytrium sp. JEL0797]